MLMSWLRRQRHFLLPIIKIDLPNSIRMNKKVNWIYNIECKSISFIVHFILSLIWENWEDVRVKSRVKLRRKILCYWKICQRTHYKSFTVTFNLTTSVKVNNFSFPLSMGIKKFRLKIRTFHFHASNRWKKTRVPKPNNQTLSDTIRSSLPVCISRLRSGCRAPILYPCPETLIESRW